MSTPDFTSVSNCGAAGNSCSRAWLKRCCIAPARFAATGGCGAKPCQSEAKCSLRLHVVGRVERALDEGFQPVGGVQVVLHPLLEHAPLVLQERLGRLAVLWREVVGVLGEPLAGEDVLQDHEHPQVLLGVLAEERGHPAQGLGPVRVRLLNAWIVLRSSRGPCPASSKGKSMTSFQSSSAFSSDESGSSRMLLNSTVQLRLVFRHQNSWYCSNSPSPCDAKLLVEHLPHAADAVALVVLAAGLLDDALGVHAGELHGDRGVDLLADADLAHAGRPGPAAP